MEVEVLLRSRLPLEGRVLVLSRVVLDDPVEAQGHDPVEEDLGHQDQEAEAAAGPARHPVLLVLAVSGKGEKENCVVVVVVYDASWRF